MPKRLHRLALLPAAAGAAALFLTGCDLLPRRPAPAADSLLAAADSADSARAAPAPPRRSPRRTSPAERSTPPRSVPRADTVRRDSAIPAPPPRPPSSTPVREDLQRLVPAQEQHLATVGRYASRAQYLALRYLPHTGVNLIITVASDSGWAGRATREGWDGRSCVIWIGKVPERPRTDRQGLQPPRPGAAVCDPD